MNPTRERKTIDSLKGIAILGIMLVHSGCSFPNILGIIANNGARGVQLMFLINGYLIFKSLDSAQQKGMGLKQWYKGKIVRIIPLYWLFTLLHLLVFGTGHRFYIGPLEKVSWLNIICNLFCLHGFFPYYIGSINLNWFIADLAIWYLIAPLCHKILNSLERMIGCLLIIVPIDYILLVFLEKHPILSSEVIWKDYVSTMCFLAEMPVILLGCMVYYMVKEGKIADIHKVTSGAGCFLAIICLAILFVGSDKFSIFSPVFSFGICFMIIMAAQLANPNIILTNSLFAVFGKYSYGIYLCHIFMIHFIDIIPMGENMKMLGIAGQIGRYLIICGISLGIAVCIEKAYGKVLKQTKCIASGKGDS